MKIFACEPITSTYLSLIRRIIKESKRPWDSLKETFPRFRSINGDCVHFDSIDAEKYVYEINE